MRVQTRFTALMTLLFVAAVVATGCGEDFDTAAGAGATGGTPATDPASAATERTYSANENVGKGVVVDSKSSFDATEQAIVERIGEFGDATRAGDYKAICADLLSVHAAKQFRSADKCVAAFSTAGEDVRDYKLSILSVKVKPDGSSAKARTSVTSNTERAQTQTLELINEHGQWYIDFTQSK